MNKFMLSLRRAILLTLLTQLGYWVNRYVITGEIDQFEFIFNRDNMIFSLKMFGVYFIMYFMVTVYFNEQK